MARTYKRDARGRFAGGGGSSGGGSKSKTLKRGRAQLSEARGKVRTAKGKLTAFDPADQTIKSSLSKRAQRGAVTKAEKRLTAVKRTAVIKGRRMTGTIGKPKGLKPGTLKGRVAGGAKKVDLTDAGFTRRLTRAKSKLSQAEQSYKERGSSIYDKPARNKVMILRSAVDQLQAARQTVRTNTVAPAQIRERLKEGKQDLVASYQKQLEVITKNAARTATRQRRSTAPRLTPAEKAAATRARNKRAKEKEQAKRMEDARRYR